MLRFNTTSLATVGVLLGWSWSSHGERVEAGIDPAVLGVGTCPARHPVRRRGIIAFVNPFNASPFWVSQQFFAPRAILTVVWVGFDAIFRGVSEFVTAFHLRGLDRRAERVERDLAPRAA